MSAAARPGPLAWGRLLRLSLGATAVADVLAGLALAGGGALAAGPRALALLVGASLCTYHGSMALNDWRDRAHDARTRPERPIPSGAVPAAGAASLGLALCLTGPLLAAAAAPSAGRWMAGVCALALAYSLGARGRLLGPALIASARAGNLALGLAYAGALDGARWLVPLAYGAYVLVVSRLGRLEDGEDDDLRAGRVRLLLWCAAGLLVSPAALLAGAGPALCTAGAAAVALAGASALARAARAPAPWTPGRVGATMGLALRRLLVFTAASALASGPPHGPWVAGAILLGYPLSWSLRRVFPPS